jgi:predicted amino acid-binding ACT domain protein
METSMPLRVANHGVNIVNIPRTMMKKAMPSILETGCFDTISPAGQY